MNFKSIIIRDISNLFEHEEDDHSNPAIVGDFWSNNYIWYENKSDKNKVLSAEEHINKIRPYLKDIINSLQKYGRMKIKIIKAIILFFPKMMMTSM